MRLRRPSAWSSPGRWPTRRRWPSRTPRLYEDARNLADRDPLTGFYNHRFLHERLGEEVVRSQRGRRPLSVLMLDLDDFKLVNDTFGHLFGDRVLTWTAELIRSTLRGVRHPGPLRRRRVRDHPARDRRRRGPQRRGAHPRRVPRATPSSASSADRCRSARRSGSRPSRPTAGPRRTSSPPRTPRCTGSSATAAHGACGWRPPARRRPIARPAGRPPSTNVPVAARREVPPPGMDAETPGPPSSIPDVSEPSPSRRPTPDAPDRRIRRTWWIFAGSFFVLGLILVVAAPRRPDRAARSTGSSSACCSSRLAAIRPSRGRRRAGGRPARGGRVVRADPVAACRARSRRTRSSAPSSSELGRGDRRRPHRRRPSSARRAGPRGDARRAPDPASRTRPRSCPSATSRTRSPAAGRVPRRRPIAIRVAGDRRCGADAIAAPVRSAPWRSRPAARIERAGVAVARSRAAPAAASRTARATVGAGSEPPTRAEPGRRADARQIADRIAAGSASVYGLTQHAGGAADVATPASSARSSCRAGPADAWPATTRRLLDEAAPEASAALARAYSLPGRRGPGVDRRADRPAEPALLRRVLRPARPAPPVGRRGRRPDDRHRPLQAAQRHLRPRRPATRSCGRSAGAIVPPVREDDVPARYGGEEFVVLLRNPSPESRSRSGSGSGSPSRRSTCVDFGVPAGQRLGRGRRRRHRADQPIAELVEPRRPGAVPGQARRARPGRRRLRAQRGQARPSRRRATIRGDDRPVPTLTSTATWRGSSTRSATCSRSRASWSSRRSPTTAPPTPSAAARSTSRAAYRDGTPPRHPGRRQGDPREDRGAGPDRPPGLLRAAPRGGPAEPRRAAPDPGRRPEDGPPAPRGARHRDRSTTSAGRPRPGALRGLRGHVAQDRGARSSSGIARARDRARRGCCLDRAEAIVDALIGGAVGDVPGVRSHRAGRLVPAPARDDRRPRPARRDRPTRPPWSSGSRRCRTVESVHHQGSHKAAVRLRGGPQVDLMIMPPGEAGTYLHPLHGLARSTTSGSAAMARDRGWSLSEKGFLRIGEDGEPLTGDAAELRTFATEAEAYALPRPAVHRARAARGRAARSRPPWPGRCRRSSRWPICAATSTATPTGRTGSTRSRQMAEAARRRGYAYQVLTDHTPSLAHRPRADARAGRGAAGDRRALNARFAAEEAAGTAPPETPPEGFRLLHGCELEIRADATLDYAGRRCWPASTSSSPRVHVARRQSREQLTAPDARRRSAARTWTSSPTRPGA